VRRNPVAEWEVSEQITHSALVDGATFLAVQRIRAGRVTQDGEVRQFVLAGLAVCGVCERRMDAHWVHGRPAYRCRHGYTSATPRPPGAPRNVYHREDHLLDVLPALLADPIGDDAERNPSQEDLVGVLRERGLQIVCTHHDRQLRRTAPYERAHAPSSTGQSTLTLGLEFHHGNGSATDKHSRPATLRPRDTRFKKPRAYALQIAVG
jgi:Recombinase zinc beta ribbon domain